MVFFFFIVSHKIVMSIKRKNNYINAIRIKKKYEVITSPCECVLVISGSSLLCDLTRSLCHICKKCTRQWRYDANNDETERIGSDAIINTGLADGIIA
jgi:hypothetical protein